MHTNASNTQQQRESHADVRRKMLDLQTRRRQQVLQRQRSARHAQLHKARQASFQQLLLDQGHGNDDHDSLPDVAPSYQRPSPTTVAAAYAQQFTQPEWLIEVPGDLASAWYAAFARASVQFS